MTVILFFLIFGIVVLGHEFGHFLLGRASGINVVEFAIGMGPTLCSVKKGGTKFSLKLFPIGGACMFEGEDGLTVSEEDVLNKKGGKFQEASVFGRLATVFAGPFFNFNLAFVVAMIMVNSSLCGIRDSVVLDVTENSAAMEAGMEKGDKIIAVNGEKVYLFDEIQLYTQLYDGGDMKVTVMRNGEKKELTLNPKYDEEYQRYMFGIANDQYVEAGGLSSLKYSCLLMRYYVKMTYKSLGALVGRKISRKDVAGPVGIAVNVVGKTYNEVKKYGVGSVVFAMLNIMLMLSVNLGILNLLPLPALDGGRIVFLLVELIRGKPIPPEKEGVVHLAGLVFFMILMVFIFFNDLVNIFGK
ncbi:MAG: RIP metalloprotease RseP [Lachnospiraceae bacterium]|nr:RIP metalloprotease RseP [Lachnospiraceae bacterium]